MKRLVLAGVGFLSLTGCVYHTPYAYPHYTTVTPVYPQRSYNYYTPVPPRPRYRGYEYEEHEYRPHFQQRYRSW